MGSDQRTYIKVHDGILDHPKVVGLSYAGVVAYLAALTYCSRYLTDGKLPAAAVKKFGTPRAAFTELVHAGLVEPDGDDWQVHDYLEHQRSADEVAELRKKRQAAGSRGGRAKANALANALASARQDAQQTAGKNVAVSETESSSKEELREDVELLCAHLADWVKQNGSNRPKVTEAWRTECRLMLDNDGRDPLKAERLIDWSQRDSFWRGNVMTMKKFRAQYDQLRIKALGEWEKSRQGVGPNGEIDVDAVLGPDLWTPGDPPAEIGDDPGRYQAWIQAQTADRRLERLTEAQAKARRSA